MKLFSDRVNFREVDWEERCIRIWSSASRAPDGKEACWENVTISVPINCVMGNLHCLLWTYWINEEYRLQNWINKLRKWSNSLKLLCSYFFCNIACFHLLILIFFTLSCNTKMFHFHHQNRYLSNHLALYLSNAIIWRVCNHMQAMPQLTDRSKLPNIIDLVIKDTMDPKHLYQVLIMNKLLMFCTFRQIYLFIYLGWCSNTSAGCSSGCSMCAARTELQTTDNRCSPLSCSSSACGARRNTQGCRATFTFSRPKTLSLLRCDPIISLKEEKKTILPNVDYCLSCNLSYL